ncbi:MAG TPA: hypothetical protein VM096_20180 [Vicinamibacterales bacterium]|nr:hypothetical protein [Vicinamibacterales bacterium]
MSIRFVAGSVCIFLVSCGPRPVELGFWLEPLSFSSPRIDGALSAEDVKTIEQVARSEIEHAFARYEATVTSHRNARYRVSVVPELKDQRLLRRTGTYAGESRAVAGFGGSGSVNFEFVANGAMVFAPDEADRDAVIASLGRGIGRVAVHEFLHQLLPKKAIHDSKDRGSYEGNSPALIEGYYGDLHWDIAGPWLDARLKRR